MDILTEVKRMESGWKVYWLRQDDPYYYNYDTDAPNWVYGWTRRGAIRKARRVLRSRAKAEAERIRKNELKRNLVKISV